MKLVNVELLEEFLLNNGLDRTNPEFNLYAENLNQMGSFDSGRLEWYYDATKVEALMRKDQGIKNVRLYQANVPNLVLQGNEPLELLEPGFSGEMMDVEDDAIFNESDHTSPSYDGEWYEAISID
mgnify:CR=1 FL=1